MVYVFKVMTQEQAEDIAFNWHYDGEYSFYDMDADEGDLTDFLNPDKRGDSTFAIMNEDEMVGFLSVNKAKNKIVDIGLGMRPDLTGKGSGMEFLKEIINFIQCRFKPEKITLSVAMFNRRAINVYRKIGFKDIEIFKQETNGSTFEFLKMAFKC